MALRIFGYLVGAVLLVVIAAAAWTASRAIQARNDLNTLRSELTTLQGAFAEQSGTGVASALSDLSRTARDARRAVKDPIWRVMNHIPIVGRSFVTSSGMVTEVEKDIAGPLKALAESKVAVSPQSLRNADGSIKVSAISDVVPKLREASAALTASGARLRRLPDTAILSAVVQQRNKLVRAGDSLAAAITSAADTGDAAVRMLGGDGTRRYFIGVQDNAETRGTGGAVSAFAIIRVADGKLTLESSGPATELKNAPADVVDLGEEYRTAWGKYHPSSTWSGSNRAASFSLAAQNWIGLRKHAVPKVCFDGAIAIDPVLLARLMEFTGPVLLRNGAPLGADKALVSTETYASKVVNTDARRQLVVQDVVTGVLKDLFSGKGDSARIASTLLTSAGQGHFMIYSTDEGVQKVIETTSLSGIPPNDARSYAKVIVNNLGGTKLDFYLRESVTYSSERCVDGKRSGHISIRLHNVVDGARVGPLVTRRADAKPGTYPRGQDRLLVSVYGTRGAQATGVTIDGKAASETTASENGIPVWSVDLTLDPGEERTIVVETSEPVLAAETAKLEVQGLVVDPTTSLDISPCS